MLLHHSGPELDPDANQASDASLTLTKAQLFALLAGRGPEGVEISGDTAALERLVSVVDRPDPTSPSPPPDQRPL